MSTAHNATIPKKRFFTTTDLLTKINDTLKEGININSDDNSDQNRTEQPHFELQRRLPDGTTRPATPSDQRVADMESKFQQAAMEVKDLSDSDKMVWARLQRHHGNELYQQGLYQEALDVYLTCLVVKNDSKEFNTQVLLPCLGNLAQCTLTLGMYHKTELYCTMALDELVEISTHNGSAKASASASIDSDDATKQVIAKLYFRRGKARRLGGKYDLAKTDLQKAQATIVHVSTTKEIQRELQLTQLAMDEAERNRLRQERAMQKVWANSTNDKILNRTMLYDDTTEKKRRTYSKLQSTKAQNDYEDDEPKTLSCWDYYLAIVGRVAERLLIMIGDKETETDKQIHDAKDE